MSIPVIAIFDVGKTNKKLFLFNEAYEIVYENTINTKETVDEDGFPCDNIDELNRWLLESWKNIRLDERFEIKALNFSGYGASFALIDAEGNSIAPLYNYLKPFPDTLLELFYDNYGGKKEFSKIAASPVLGNLNSGMQLYFLKYEKPLIFEKIVHALHLPQYLSSVFTKKYFSEITSIGCHTNMWDFTQNKYHYWIEKEGIHKKIDTIAPSDFTTTIDQTEIGIGLHDSSAALIPYLKSKLDTEQFILISTGTWCISLNPFSDNSLTDNDLENDCLSFLQYIGKPVKASRVFAGQFHEDQTRRIAQHFGVENDFYKTIKFEKHLLENDKKVVDSEAIVSLDSCDFESKNLANFTSIKVAYHQLISDLVQQQVFSTNFILDKNETLTTIYVDGGFSKNEIYMNLLSMQYPENEIFGAEVAQASALGAALILHSKWNRYSVPKNLITLRKYNHAQL